MNLIVCGEDCVHQKEGYCNLEKPSVVTDPRAAETKHCLYYTPAKKQALSLPQIEKPDGL